MIRASLEVPTESSCPTSPARSRLMKRVRRTGTAPEIAVRRILTIIGAKYRMNVPDLPGTPDIANKSRRKAIFVHGCYWHHHPGCDRATIPKGNQDFWLEKFRSNAKRDAEKIEALHLAGFDVLVVWECELRNVEALKRRIFIFWNS